MTEKERQQRKEANARYLATPKGKTMRARIEARRRNKPERIASVKAAEIRYRATPKGKETTRIKNKRTRTTPDWKPSAAVYNANYRASKRNAPGSNHTLAERMDIFSIHGGLCVWCRVVGNETPATELDHVVPLSKGGSDSVANLAPSCGPCNHSKNAKDPDAFALGLMVSAYLDRRPR